MTDVTALPGIGKNMAAHLHALGYHSVESLRGADPEEMYQRDCILHGGTLDRCVLYTYRCAVYCAETPNPAPEKQKWWNWKETDVSC